jgi:MinD-like ATPase involved in chromosome partitioning or flagellar assembly
MSTGAVPGAGHAATPVLVAAAGSPWEARALELLERRGSGVVLVRRCVDLPDLLAAAGAGVASVALVSPTLPGLDADSVSRLRRLGLGVVLVAAPEELLDGDIERLRRLGIEHLLASTELGSLVETVTGASAEASAVAAPRDVTAAPTGEEPGVTGRLVAVWGPTGAPGRTTVAVGVAAEIAASGRSVLLADVDAYGGAVAQHLGILDELSGLLGAARAANTGQLGPDRLGTLARQVGPRLRVLTGLPRPDRWQEVRPAAFADVLDQAARLASYVVLDLGFSLESDPVDPYGSSAPQRNEMTLAALRRADEVLVVGSADPVGLSRLARGLVELHVLLPGLLPRVVVNRTRPSLGWSDREIQGMVEGFVRPVDVHFLPEDRAAADRALMAGCSLGESGGSALSDGLHRLARDLLGEPRSGTPRRRRVTRRRAGRAR